jgi:hypothetical protein
MENIDMDKLLKKIFSSKKLEEILGSAEGMFDNTNIIQCPICGFDYSGVKLKDLRNLSSDSYKARRGRGSCLEIPFEGECGHSWSLCIGFYKGQSFIFIDYSF